MANYILEGNLIGLRAFDEKDLESNWYDWFNDPQITKYLSGGGAIPNTRVNQKLYFENIIVKFSDRVAFAVEEKKNQTLIGVCSVSMINWIHRHGDIAIIIGEKKYHRGGYALEIYHLIVKHAFMSLNLHKLKTATLEENIVSLKYCELIGFKHIGIGKDEFYKNGKYLNCVFSELLRDDWFKLQSDDK